jgi:hypothetical protein
VRKGKIPGRPSCATRRDAAAAASIVPFHHHLGRRQRPLLGSTPSPSSDCGLRGAPAAATEQEEPPPQAEGWGSVRALLEEGVEELGSRREGVGEHGFAVDLVPLCRAQVRVLHLPLVEGTAPIHLLSPIPHPHVSSTSFSTLSLDPSMLVAAHLAL